MLSKILRALGLAISFSLFVGIALSHATEIKDKQADLPKVRVGVLVSGSVHWQIETLKSFNFDRQNGIEVVTVPLASVNALLVALQGDAVDVIVSDWVWVAKQRNRNKEFMFYPFSTSIGGMVAPVASEIKGINDLIGKKIGVAGGPEGKSWLLLTAYARDKYNIDLEQQAQVKFVAPPLVNALLKRNQIDVGLNYWHFNSVLDKSRYTEVLSGQDILKAIGVSAKVPMLGWVFQKNWANKDSARINGFLNAAYLAAQKLDKSNDAWVNITHLLKPEQKEHSLALRDAFRNGIVQDFDNSDIENIKAIFKILETSRSPESKRMQNNSNNKNRDNKSGENKRAYENNIIRGDNNRQGDRQMPGLPDGIFWKIAGEKTSELGK